ncbi:MAG: PaaX family transcriptional regulator [Streptosporangiaceae bacterium]|nr:PaaX family transcriptional regulator [Streptosporangiaceae bacterium]
MGGRRAVKSGTPAVDAAPMRPQSLMLTFLGHYVLGRDVSVSSGTFIEVFGRLGVSEQATRSTLTRMVARDLLRRGRRGRRVYFGLTPRSEAILRDGETRIQGPGPVNEDPGGCWTLVGFSFPESWSRERRDLRSQLIWSGFGMLHSGLWMAPSTVDVTETLERLGLRDHVKVFTARPAGPTDIAQLVHEAFDLDALAERYRAFLRRWDRPSPLPKAPDDLARQLHMKAEWLQLTRHDPRLPARQLPDGWPAARAQQVFRELDASFEGPARCVLGTVLDAIPTEPA